MRHFITAAISLVFTGGVVPDVLYAGETIASVAHQAIQASKKHASVQAKLLMRMDVGTGDSKQLKSIGKGSYEQLSEGDVIKFRMDLKNNLVIETDTKIIDTPESSVSIVCNGLSVFTLTDNMGEKSAVKNLSQPTQSLAASKAFFDSLFRENYVQLLPDEKLDGKEVWVIESKPKMLTRGRPVKTIHYILKDCGLRVKTTSHNEDGVQIQLTLLSEIKLDDPVPPERFVFNAPKGVRVVDLTK